MDLPFQMITENDIEKWRRDTFWTKEPETIEWIESMSDGEVLWDIGANIGIYSLYFASLYPNGKVYAFEPSAANYLRLRENIALNGFNNIKALPFALSDRAMTVKFCEPSTVVGASGGQIGKDIEGTESLVSTISVDLLVTTGIIDTAPNHIKVDVDGQERPIVWGMSETLQRPEMRSLLIEIDNRTWEFALTVDDVQKCGYTMNNRFNIMPNHSRIRREREGIHCENVVFTRR